MIVSSPLSVQQMLAIQDYDILQSILNPNYNEKEVWRVIIKTFPSLTAAPMELIQKFKSDQIRYQSFPEISARVLVDFGVRLSVIGSQRAFIIETVVGQMNLLFQKRPLTNPAGELSTALKLFYSYDRGHSRSAREEVARIISCRGLYSLDCTYYLSEVNVRKGSDIYTFSLAGNLSGTDFLDPMVITNIPNSKYNYMPTGLMNSYQLEAYLMQIDMVLNAQGKKILLICRNNAVVDQAKLSNIKLLYINVTFDKYFFNHNIVKFPDDYGMNHWIKFNLANAIFRYSSFDNVELLISAVLKEYRYSVNRLLKDPVRKGFCALNLKASQFCGYRVPATENLGQHYTYINGVFLIKGENYPHLSTSFYGIMFKQFNYNYSSKDIYYILDQFSRVELPGPKTTSHIEEIIEFVDKKLYPFISQHKTSAIEPLLKFVFSLANGSAPEHTKYTESEPRKFFIKARLLRDYGHIFSMVELISSAHSKALLYDNLVDSNLYPNDDSVYLVTPTDSPFNSENRDIVINIHKYIQNMGALDRIAENLNMRRQSKDLEERVASPPVDKMSATSMNLDAPARTSNPSDDLVPVPSHSSQQNSPLSPELIPDLSKVVSAKGPSRTPPASAQTDKALAVESLGEEFTTSSRIGNEQREIIYLDDDDEEEDMKTQPKANDRSMNVEIYSVNQRHETPKSRSASPTRGTEEHFADLQKDRYSISPNKFFNKQPSIIPSRSHSPDPTVSEDNFPESNSKRSVGSATERSEMVKPPGVLKLELDSASRNSPNSNERVPKEPTLDDITTSSNEILRQEVANVQSKPIEIHTLATSIEHQPQSPVAQIESEMTKARDSVSPNETELPMDNANSLDSGPNSNDKSLRDDSIGLTTEPKENDVNSVGTIKYQATSVVVVNDIAVGDGAISSAFSSAIEAPIASGPENAQNGQMQEEILADKTKKTQDAVPISPESRPTQNTATISNDASIVGEIALDPVGDVQDAVASLVQGPAVADSIVADPIVADATVATSPKVVPLKLPSLESWPESSHSSDRKPSEEPSKPSNETANSTSVLVEVMSATASLLNSPSADQVSSDLLSKETDDTSKESSEKEIPAEKAPADKDFVINYKTDSRYNYLPPRRLRSEGLVERIRKDVSNQSKNYDSIKGGKKKGRAEPGVEMIKMSSIVKQQKAKNLGFITNEPVVFSDDSEESDNSFDPSRNGRIRVTVPRSSGLSNVILPESVNNSAHESANESVPKKDFSIAPLNKEKNARKELSQAIIDGRDTESETQHLPSALNPKENTGAFAETATKENGDVNGRAKSGIVEINGDNSSFIEMSNESSIHPLKTYEQNAQQTLDHNGNIPKSGAPVLNVEAKGESVISPTQKEDADSLELNNSNTPNIPKADSKNKRPLETPDETGSPKKRPDNAKVDFSANHSDKSKAVVKSLLSKESESSVTSDEKAVIEVAMPLVKEERVPEPIPSSQKLSSLQDILQKQSTIERTPGPKSIPKAQNLFKGRNDFSDSNSDSSSDSLSDDSESETDSSSGSSDSESSESESDSDEPSKGVPRQPLADLSAINSLNAKLTKLSQLSAAKKLHNYGVRRRVISIPKAPVRKNSKKS